MLLSLASPLQAAERSGPNPGNMTPLGAPNVAQFTGAFTYAYPINVPPGRLGVQPNLTLVYNSQAENGWLGVGWDLSVGAIYRSTRKGIPTYNDDNDKFIINFGGQTGELVQIGTGGSGSGSYREYRPQLEDGSFMRIRYYYNDDLGPMWQVWTKDGRYHEFRGLAPASSPYFYWGLTKVQEPHGNYMTLTYNTPSGGCPPGVSCAPAPGGGSGTMGYIPTEILYTGRGSVAPAHKIAFEYEPRSDVITTYRGGFEQKMAERVKWIKVWSADGAGQPTALVRRYEFTYITNSAGSSLLSSITEYGKDGGALPATTFTYGTAQNTLPGNPNFNLPTDLVYRHISGGLEFSTPEGVEFADVNGDGLLDLLQNLHGGYAVKQNAWINTGTGWSQNNAWIPPARLINREIPYVAADEGVRLVDLNGDGRVDVLKGVTGMGAEQKAWINNGQGWDQASTSWNPPIFIHRNSLDISVDQGVRFADLNGDGLTDLIKGFYHELNGNLVTQTYTSWLNTGSGWQEDSRWAPSFALVVAQYFTSGQNPELEDMGGRFVDLNGDGLTDLMRGYGGLRQAWFNTGNGWTPAPSQWNPPISFVVSNGADWVNAGVDFADMNGDGLADIVQYLSGSNGEAKGVWLNNGNGWTPDNSYLPSKRLADWWVGGGQVRIIDEGVRLADLNGDGRVDLLQSEGMAGGSVKSTELRNVSVAPVLTRVRNPLGGAVDAAYEVHHPNTGALPFPVTVINSVTTQDGMGNFVQTTYSYSGGLFDKDPWDKKEFLGFQEVRATDGAGAYTITHFNQNGASDNGVNLYKGRVQEQIRYDASNNPLVKTVYNYGWSQINTGVYFVKLDQVDNYTVISGSADKDVRTTYQYDSYGNVITETHLGDVTTSSDDKTISTGYAYNDSAYLVAYPVHTQVLNGGGQVLRENWIWYDNQSHGVPPIEGNVSRVQNLLAGGDNVSVTRSYSASGLLTDEYDARWFATSGAEGNHTQWIYDSMVQQYAVTITQAAGTSLALSESFTYDYGTGQVLTQTDANGETTVYTYDQYGRLTKVKGPLDSDQEPTISYVYTLNSSPPHNVLAKKRIRYTSGETLDTYTLLDGLGRTIETKSPAPDGKQVVSGWVLYNNRGQVWKAYAPITVTASGASLVEVVGTPHNTFTYDALGRVTRVDNPDGTYSLKSYNVWTENVQDENNHVKNYERDAFGRIVRVTENLSGQGYNTYYAYDALGSLTRITNAQGQQTNVTYDTLGRKTALSDPQMGNWTYQYDANGNLISQTDALSQTIAMSYDRLNRLTAKTYPDSTQITYQYDSVASGNKGKGRLTSVTDLSGATAFTYDALGRITQKQRTIGSAVYTTNSAFNSMSQETSLTYPDGKTIGNTYEAGLLKTAYSGWDGTVFATLGYDTEAVGKVKTLAYGNTLTANYTYRSDNFRLNTLITNNAQSQAQQSFAYGYDNVGNITAINDNVTGNGGNFTYDDLHRLATANGAYGYKTYAYDILGNLSLNPESPQKSWAFEDASGLVSVQGSVVVSSNGRTGNGLYFDNASQARLAGTEGFTPQTALSVEVWARPKALPASDVAVLSKSGVFGFPILKPDGGIEGKITLSGGATITVAVSSTVAASSGTVLNHWKHYVMTFDGSNLKVYINGQLKGTQAASGILATNQNPVLAGAPGFQGYVDEFSFHSRALTQAEIASLAGSYPNIVPNQPLTPAPSISGQLSGQIGTQYAFKFTATDQDGNELKYRIDWGSGSLQDTGYVPSGTTVEASHAWTEESSYTIKVQAIELVAGNEVGSDWSPGYAIYIAPAIDAVMSTPTLNGAAVGISETTSTIASFTIGEVVVSTAASANHKLQWGYTGAIRNPNVWWAIALGSQGVGGWDAAAPPKVTVDSFVNLAGTTTAQVDQIALGLRQHGYIEQKDANGNYKLSGGRWIKYDFENRPIRVITADGTKTEFTYDFEGTRVKKSVIASGATQSTIFIGTIYEQSADETIKYIHAGGQRVAMIKHPLAGGSDTTYYFLADHLGSTHRLADNTGNMVRTNKFTPFGSLWETTGTGDSDYKFALHRRDDTTGDDYMGARYYHSARGAFLTPDTLIQAPYDPQSLNRYSYVRNNPIRYTDPDGHRYYDNHKHKNWLGTNAAHFDAFLARNHMSGSIGVGGSAGGADPDKYTGRVGYQNSPAIPMPMEQEPSSPNAALVASLLDYQKGWDRGVAISEENMVADAEGKTGKAAKAAYTVAEWSERAAWGANFVSLGATASSIYTGPLGLSVAGISGGFAAGADIVATIGYGTHYALTRERGSLYRGIATGASIPLDMVPMFKPGIVAKYAGGGWGFYKGSAYLARWYGTARVFAADAAKYFIGESIGAAVKK